MHGGQNIGKLIDLPAYEHIFLGQLHHMITTLFNRREMEHWTTNFGTLLGSSQAGLLNNIDQRSNFVMSRLPQQVFFQIGTELPDVESTVLVDATRQARVLVPSITNGGDQLAEQWIQPEFVATDAWKTGTAGIGFEPATGTFADLITLDVSAEMAGVNPSAFIRIPFQLDGDPAEFDRLKLRMKYDDGFVAYLNGQTVAEANAPNAPQWDSPATGSHRNSDAVQFVDYDITSQLAYLRPGENVLAIQGMNRLVSSNDFLIVPELIAETIPQTATKTATVDTPSIALDGRGWVNVREIWVEGATAPLNVDWTESTSWSAVIPLQPGENALTLQAIDYSGNVVGTDRINVTSTVPRPILDHLRISEVMYHAVDPNAAEAAAGFDDDDQFDFIELLNTSTTESLNLSGVHFEGGVRLAFADLSLAPGQRTVAVADVAAFRQRYGSQIDVAGQYSGSLSNGGETVQLHDAAGTLILEMSYGDDDPWPVRADGNGASLELIDPMTPVGLLDRFDVWRPSTDFGGSPGRQGAAPVGIVINEVLANTDPPLTLSDSIELLNTSNQTIDLSGWYLSDSANQLLKYALPLGTTLAPGQYLVVDESRFNATPANPGPNDFALSGSQGDDVWLVIPAAGGGISRFVDDLHFGASATGESWGRTPNGIGRLVPQTQRSLGTSNAAPRLGPIVISEIQYAPAMPSSAALNLDPTLTRDDLEYIELHNASSDVVDLNGWSLAGGIDFRFGSGVTLEPNRSLLVVSFSPFAAQNSAP